MLSNLAAKVKKIQRTDKKMLARDLITDEIPPLKVTDTGEKALRWMEEFKVWHLPVVKGTEFLGLISETNILDLNQPNESINNLQQGIIRPTIIENQHIYTVLKVVADLDLSVIPVLDSNNEYLGSSTLSNLTTQIIEITAVNEPGGIIVLELNSNDYSMMEISQIIEGNDAKILSSFLTPVKNSTKLELTLKINREDLSGVLQTFNRYGYTVNASFQVGDSNSEIKDHYDSLMYFLNM